MPPTTNILQLSSPVEGQLPEGVTLIDIIIYTASFASTPTAIDPILDRVRSITAQLGPTKQPGPEQIRALVGVYNDLETYMIEREPLRNFTRQSLRQAINDHFQKQAKSKGLWQQVAVVWLGVVAGFILPFFLLPKDSAQEDIYAPTAIACAFAVLHIGAIWMFLSALRSFKPELQAAYRWICLDIFLLGLSLLQVPLFIVLRQWQWLSHGGITTPMVLAVLFIYVGIVAFCRLVNIKSRFLSWKWTFGVIGVATIIGIVMPHTYVDAPELLLDYSLFTLLSTGIMAVICVYLTHRLIKVLGLLYRRPLRWLWISLGILAFTMFQFAALQLWVPTDHWYSVEGYSQLPLLIYALTILKAGTSFRKSVQ